MRFIFFIIASFFGEAVFAQLPEFNSNTSCKDSAQSFLLKAAIADYDFVFAYSERNRFPSPFYILALKDNTWSAIEIHQHSSNRGEMASISKYSFPSDSAVYLLNELAKLGFWTLDNDSLRYDYEKLKIVRVFDASTEVFETFSKGKYRITESYSPDSYLINVPPSAPHRKFVFGRTLFLSVYKRNRR